MRSYVDSERLTRINLMRYGASAWGAWEDLSRLRFGLVEGTVRGDGSVALRLYLGGLAPARLEGRLNTGETRLVCELSGEGSPRGLDLRADWKAVGGLAVRSLEAAYRDGSTAAAAGTSFRAIGIEPSAGADIVSWYRGQFSAGESLSRQMEGERDRFFSEFGMAGAGLAPGAAIVPWTYDSRSFVAYRSQRILSLGTRTAIYRGGASGRIVTRLAAIDAVQRRLLELGDFVPEDRRPELGRLLTQRAREELGLRDGQSLVGSGFYEEGLGPGTAFLVCGAGLVFHYDAAEAADQGELWVLLDWKRLAPLLVPGTLERFGIGGGQ